MSESELHFVKESWMSFLPSVRIRIMYSFAFVLLFLVNSFLLSRSAGYAQPVTDADRQDQEPCPGELMEVQITGERRSQPVTEAVINGEPWGGTFWEAGSRSFWHCHAGGQLLVIWEGEGRIQRRGERVRVLSAGEADFAGPGEEHWHGATTDSGALYVGTIVQPGGTYWMEEVSQDDYLGNDIGINSRNEFLRTGVQRPTNR